MRTGRKVQTKRVNGAIEAYKSGVLIKDICIKFDYTPQYLGRLLKKYGVERNRMGAKNANSTK